jgi:phenylacetyl-CoA:acceptor oxidoreductase subunit 2
MIPLILKEPVKQGTWRWPAAVNFIIGGTGGGVYLFSFFQAFAWFGSPFFSKSLHFGFIPPLLICVGFLCLAIEAGRPLRGCYLFRNLQKSWISRETVFCFIFIPASVCDYFYPDPVFKLLAITAALGFLVSQGFIVYRARAITAWNIPIIPLVFLSSALLSGYGLFLILTVTDLKTSDQAMLFFGFISLFFNLLIWLVYLRQSGLTDFYSTTKKLRQFFSLTITIGLGQIIPLFLLLFLLLQKHTIAPVFLSPMIVLCGILLLIGNFSQKIGILISAGYFRAIELKC